MDKLFTRVRFEKIWRFLCFHDKTKIYNISDVNYKIQNLVKPIINTSRISYAPTQDLSLKIHNLKFHGRKRKGFTFEDNYHDLKMVILCESDTGYIYNWKTITRKHTHDKKTLFKFIS